MPLEQGIELRARSLRVPARRGIGGGEQRVGHAGERRYDHDRVGAAMRALEHPRYPLQRLGVRYGRAAELEDRRLTHRLTSGNPLPRRANAAPRSTVDAIDCGEADRRTTIAARYTPAFGRPAGAGRRAGGGDRLRKAGSCEGACSSAKAARGPRALSSGTGRRDREPYGNPCVCENVPTVHDSCDITTHYLNG